MPTSDPISQLVIAAFKECFPKEAINLESDFFDLGGDSLALVSLCTSLEVTLGFEIAPSTLLYHPTVEELSDAVNELSKDFEELNTSN